MGHAALCWGHGAVDAASSALRIAVRIRNLGILAINNEYPEVVPRWSDRA